MKQIITILFLLIYLFSTDLTAQEGLFKDGNTFTKQDTLRGSITPERIWWDLKYYHLDVAVDPQQKFIKGENTIQYEVLKSSNILQIDLQSPLKITKIIQDDKELEFSSEGYAHYIRLQKKQLKGNTNAITVFYEGHPKEAKNAPWDGGFSWKKDKNGKDFVATSCQGLGASVWWPNKDHMYDEVDSMAISIKVPKGLVGVANGRLRKIDEHKDDSKTYHWFVSNPINNYGVNVNIGDYVQFSEKYDGEGGKLDMDYYVLKDNMEKAQIHFKDAPRTIEALEHWFGKYPFYEDSFKLVEVPYLGMEHQSSVTYGNQYVKGYAGRDLSQTGWGLKFDFIIVHESGHEWFANSITNKDIADMWVHESFTSYSESLFLEYYYGKKAGEDYVIGTRALIANDKPIIGVYNVNSEGSGDMYFKGANMLHTIRTIIDDDTKWRAILRGLNETFFHKTVTTKEIEEYINQKSGIDFSKVFDQYLRTIDIPVFDYKIEQGKLKYKWTNVIKGFTMPIALKINTKEVLLYPSDSWQEMKLSTGKSSVIEINRNFYVKKAEE
ncbi:M1 family metallopeptidase [Tenacibaculum agarivorans]|uniref:M1 family metallopeptidase n=1 Tax=Tenacibaculum agarivorans TaxID=1908389 RepID=UPI00094BAA4B|nr:M1 family metallopeptidase [Tenacibaculum agarivorans]